MPQSYWLTLNYKRLPLNATIQKAFSGQRSAISRNRQKKLTADGSILSFLLDKHHVLRVQGLLCNHAAGFFFPFGG